MTNYTIVDVETASRRMPSICSLGLVNVEEGVVKARHHYYIKPPGRFEIWNTRVHGIEAYQVKAAPSFSEIWPEIKDYCENSILIAHNASFDLGQITASLREAKIDFPDLYYIDTVKLAGRVYPGFSKYNLAFLSLVMDANLGSHHDALSDATATGEIFAKMQKDYPLERSNISIYGGSVTASSKHSTFMGALHSLRRIMTKQELGAPLSSKTRRQLISWLRKASEHRHTYPFHEVVLRVEYLLKRDNYVEGVYWILERIYMKYYAERKAHNLPTALSQLEQILGKAESFEMERWLEMNSYLREEFLFNELWRQLWEFRYLGQGDLDSMRKKLHFYLRPFEGYYDKEKMRDKRVLLVGDFSQQQLNRFQRDLRSVNGQYAMNPSHKVDIVVIIQKKAGLDYTQKLRKVLKMKEEGAKFTLLAIGKTR